MNGLRGVNLGGWLVLEKWITPSLFAGTDAEDEYSFSQTPNAREKIAKHRENWIIEADFAWLADHGVEAVRIPVGYWLLGNEPPYFEGATYLDWAFDMAQKYNLRVLLDLHGLPSSQNGHDHSGRIGQANWQKNRADREKSLVILRQFAERYARHPALWGIEIINEPNPGIFQLALRSYYYRAYRLLDPILPKSLKIVYADAWSPRIFAFALLGKRRAVMDVHLYHMATLGTATHSLDWYYRNLARRVRYLRLLQRLHPIIIGEWSGVIRGETIGSLPAAEQNQLQQKHYEVQTDYYKIFAGEFYWTYKTETSGSLNYWNYRSIVENRTTS